MSPRDMRNRLCDRIEAEITHVREGRSGTLWAKMNSLVDPAIIEKLYEASNAGVNIELVVRGICCLRPGVPGMSENIRVKSVRSEEHTSELQSLMRISYAVFCLKKKNITTHNTNHI